MITVNYGYARYGTSAHPDRQAAHLAAEWVRYDSGRTKYWEVGNESYGPWEAGWMIDTQLNKDGQPQIMTGAVYGKHFRVFADSMRKAASEIGADIKIGASLIGKLTPNADNPAEYDWNSGYFSQAGDDADYYVVHSYYTNHGEDSDVETILNSAASETRSIKQYLEKSFKENKRIPKALAMTEWNIFAEGSRQKTSHIAGVHAVLALGELIEANFTMAARWHLLGKYTNGEDFATLSIGDEPDNPLKWNPRPVFFYLYYFKKMVGDHLVRSTVTGSQDIAAYASKFSLGNAAGVIVVNKGAQQQTVEIDIVGTKLLQNYYYYLVEGDGGQQFSRKVIVNGKGSSLSSGGPANFESIPARHGAVADGIQIILPKHSVVFLTVSGE